MRVTARTGTVGVGAVLQITRAFTSCACAKIIQRAVHRSFHQNSLHGVVHLLRDEIDLWCFRSARRCW